MACWLSNCCVGQTPEIGENDCWGMNCSGDAGICSPPIIETDCLGTWKPPCMPACIDTGDATGMEFGVIDVPGMKGGEK